jgi:chemotaxis protein methyltransferase CheR
MLGEELGLRLDGAMEGRLARCVVDEARAHHLGVRSYGEQLTASPELRQGLVDGITVQETSFFRDPTQLDAFRDHVLGAPGGVAGRATGPLRMWSAGCANGQEPYSLAMLLAESGIHDWRLTATDVSGPALARTRRARYSAREVTGLSPERLRRHFVAVGNEWEVVPALRDRVEVLHHNLVNDRPPFEAGACQVVFCRNVLIYLRPKSAIVLLDWLAQYLDPEGWLFIGYAESLWRISEGFQLVRLGEGFAYRRTERAAPSAPISVKAPRGKTAVRSARPGVAPLAVGGRDSRSRPHSVTAGVARLLAEGEMAMNAGRLSAAVAVFRRCSYLDPSDPVVHLHLALALEEAGDRVAARRAYAVARRTIGHAGGDTVQASLDGYHTGELLRLLDAKLGPPPPPPPPPPPAGG